MFGSKRKPEPDFEELLGRIKPVFSPTVIVTQEIDYRPCYVNGRRALFHRWANSARAQLPGGVKPDENARYFQYRNTHAIVEYEDGTVDKAWPHDIRFADGGRFADYEWLPAEKKPTDEELGIW